MAENQFPSTVDALLKGMDNFITTKTVVGEPLKVEDAVIIPLMDVSCGMEPAPMSRIPKPIPAAAWEPGCPPAPSW